MELKTYNVIFNDQNFNIKAYDECDAYFRVLKRNKIHFTISTMAKVISENRMEINIQP